MPIYWIILNLKQLWVIIETLWKFDLDFNTNENSFVKIKRSIMEYMILQLLFIYHGIYKSCVPSSFACKSIWSKQVNKSWGNMYLVSGYSVTEKNDKMCVAKSECKWLLFTNVFSSQVICIINCNAHFAIYLSCLLWLLMARDPIQVYRTVVAHISFTFADFMTVPTLK